MVVKELTNNADEDGSGDVSVGDTLMYTITATNTGNIDLNNVVVSDDLTGDSTTCGLVVPNDTCVLETSYVVQASDLGTTIHNVGTADSDETPPTTDDEDVPVPDPSLTVVKELTNNADEDGSGDVSVGDTLMYTITATNNGTANLTNVVVSDDLTGDSTTCGLVVPNDTCVLETSYVVQASDLGTTIHNVGTADSDETPPTTDDEDVPVPDPSLTVVKELTNNADEDGSGDVSVGDTLMYTITATNNGTANLTNVVVSDDLTGDSTTCGLVVPNDTCVLETSYVVQASDLGTTIHNVGTADSDETPPTTDDDEDVPVPDPSLTVVKELTNNADEDGSGDVSVGDTLMYTITATNNGTANLTNVVVSDDLTGDSTTCGLVVPNDTCVLETSYVVQASDLGTTIHNVGTADSDETPPTTDDEDVPVPDPSLTVVKELTNNADEDGSGDVSVGDTLMYTITATNNGTANLTNVVVSDDLTGDSTTCGLVVPNDTCVLETSYVVQASDLGTTIHNVGTADSDETPPTTDDEDVPVPDPSLTVVKELTNNADEDGSGDVSVGDTLMYTITATNNGTANLTNVVVSDDLTGDSTTCGLVVPNDTCVLETSYVVQASDLGTTIHNVGTADSDETPPTTDDEDVPVPDPSLTVVKELTNNADEDGSGDVSVGDTLMYTITATNNGTANLTNVVVSDDLTGDSTTCGLVVPNDTCVLETSYVVQASDLGTTIHNVGTADSDETPPTTDDEDVPVPDPSLTVVKELTNNADEDGSGDVSVGDTLMYTITATNNGTANLTNVVVSDDLTGDSTTCGLVVPNDTCVLETSYVVQASDLGTTIHNVGTADSDETPPTTDDEDVPVPGKPSIDIRKQIEGPDSREFLPGSVVDFEIVVTNNGMVNLTNVVVNDPLVPACNRTIGSMEVGESVSYICTTTLTPDEPITKLWKDDFNPAYSYLGNDGTEQFSGPWIEDDPQGGGAYSGRVLVGSNQKLWLNNYNYPGGTSYKPSVRRSLDLSGMDIAELSFDWITHSGVDSNDGVTLEISSDGGSSYTAIKTLYGANTSGKSELFNITPYISSNTVVRFRVTHNYGGSNETLKIDNFKVTANSTSGVEGFINVATATGSSNGQTVSDTDTSTVTVGSPNCVPCAEGVTSMSLRLNWRTSYADTNERIRVRAGGLGGQVLYDTWHDSRSGNGLPVGAVFSFNVPAWATEIVVTVQGNQHPYEYIKARFSTDCDLNIGTISGNNYISFEVTDVEFDGPQWCPDGPTPPAELSTTTIKGAYAGNCLDNLGSDVNFSVYKRACTGALNQEWEIRQLGNYYEIVNADSLKCLDVNSGSTSVNSEIGQWACHQGDNQLWEIQDYGSNYLIKSKSSGLCLEVISTGHAYQYTCDGYIGQQWVLTKP